MTMDWLRTKIVCTLGPSTDAPGVLVATSLVEPGRESHSVQVVRL